MTAKTYLVASAFFLILVILFQALSVGMDFTGELYIHAFDEGAREAAVQMAEPGADAPAWEAAPAQAPYVLLGTRADAAFESAAWMLDTLKLPYVTRAAMDEATWALAPRGVIVAGERLAPLGDLARFADYVRGGGQAVFALLPRPQDEAEWAFARHMGIQAIGDVAEHEQLEFYEGLLLGGMVRYEALPTRAADITLSNLCKVWGMMWEGNPDAREAEVPLLFERRDGGGTYVVMNTSLLAQRDGIGFLQAMLAIGQDALLTPAVNAATLSLLNFPALDGDSARLEAVYARGARKTVRDILWGDLLHMLRSNDLSATAFIADANIAFGDEEAQLFAFLIRSMAESRSELGVMGEVSFAGALEDTFAQYEILSGYGTAAEGVRTVAVPPDEEGTLPASTGEVAYYPILTEGFEDTDALNLRVRSFATGLYMIHHAVDMRRPIDLETADDAWHSLSRGMSRLLYAMMRPYGAMRRANVTDASAAWLAYALSAPAYSHDEAGVTIHSGLAGGCAFLLRTHRAIGEVEGLRVERLEDSIYLVTLSGESGRIGWAKEVAR